MSDQEFLMWIHERLEHQHKENSLTDYMHRLRCIIESMDPEQVTPNDGRGCNGLERLRVKLHSSQESVVNA